MRTQLFYLVSYHKFLFSQAFYLSSKNLNLNLTQILKEWSFSIKEWLNFLRHECRIAVGLWCLMPLSTIFQLYRGGQFYWWRKPEYPGKKNHWPVASHWQTLSHNVVSSTPRLSGIRTHNVSDDRHWLHR